MDGIEKRGKRRWEKERNVGGIWGEGGRKGEKGVRKECVVWMDGCPPFTSSHEDLQYLPDLIYTTSERATATTMTDVCEGDHAIVEMVTQPEFIKVVRISSSGYVSAWLCGCACVGVCWGVAWVRWVCPAPSSFFQVPI